ncbi:MAG: hypothetical protein OH319_05160 [Candidatus Parvarchaeota archaeon]|nr:hypothetical protein [Candidatus Jingweiarchaeum tengchongense]
MKAKEKFHSFISNKCGVCKKIKPCILFDGTYLCADCWRKKLIEMALNRR